jgi:hypothetical protein
MPLLVQASSSNVFPFILLFLQRETVADISLFFLTERSIKVNPVKSFWVGLGWVGLG